MNCMRKCIVFVLVLSGFLNPDTARADSPLWVAFQVVSGLASIAGLAYAVLDDGTTTTTTTTTDENGTTTTTTTQNKRMAGSPEPSAGDALIVADHEIVWDGGYLVKDRALRAAPDLARDEIFIGGYRRIDESLDILLAPPAVKSIKVSTERVMNFQVGRVPDVAPDKEVPFSVFIAIDALELSTRDIAETMGAAELELIIKEQGAAKPLFESSFAVEQGQRPTIKGQNLKADRVKVAKDLLVLRDVLGTAEASLGAQDKTKDMTIIIRTTGYGERAG